MSEERWILGGIVALIALLVWGMLVGAHQRQAGPHAGVVVYKRHDPAFTTFYWVGKVMIPVQYRDEYRLFIEADGRRNDWAVGAAVYETARPGMLYNADTQTLTRSAYPSPDQPPRR